MSTNPEFLFHHQNILYSRRSTRRAGFLFLTFGVPLLIIALPLTILSITLHRYHLLAFLIDLVVVTCLYRAISALRKGFAPITNEEIEQRRQLERKQLFSQAQGSLPREYKLPTRVAEVILGLVSGFIGISTVIFTSAYLANEWVIFISGIIISLYAPITLIHALILKPRKARSLRSVSNRELALRFSLGEMTQGDKDL
jgi:hypothetical protein